MPNTIQAGIRRDVIKDLEAIRQLVERVEARLSSTEGDAEEPYERRRQLLAKIYRSGNTIGYGELEPLLRSRGTGYQWIAQQKKKGYLAILPLPDGGKRYAVTPKAVRELRLDRKEESHEEELAEIAELSEEVFAEDWESDEDAIYDEL